jgi:hypothetical protein
MSAIFSFDVDPRLDLVRIRMSGFFTPEEIVDFAAERRKAHARLACGPNEHLTVNDLRGMTIQPQESVEKFGEMLASPEYRSRRLAFVVSPTLAQRQLLRALAGRHARFFEDPVAAEAWLIGGDSQTELLRATG